MCSLHSRARVGLSYSPRGPVVRLESRVRVRPALKEKRKNKGGRRAGKKNGTPLVCGSVSRAGPFSRGKPDAHRKRANASGATGVGGETHTVPRLWLPWLVPWSLNLRRGRAPGRSQLETKGAFAGRTDTCTPGLTTRSKARSSLR